MSEQRYRPVPRVDLLFNVEMALKKANRVWPRKPAPGDHDRYRPVAKEIVAHLELCGIEFFRKQPSRRHSTSLPVAGPGRGDRMGDG